MRRLRAAAIVLTLLAIGAAALWFSLPHTLPTPQHALQVERSARVFRDGRALEHVALHGSGLGDIGVTVSLPDPLPAKPLPILVVLGGLGTGENNIRYLTDAGDTAIIGYDWPMPVHFYDNVGSLTQLPGLYHRIMAIPAAVSSVLFWAATQPWGDRGRISLLGFSLGALAAPAIQDVAERDGQAIGWTILAYGGAPFGALVTANPHVKPGWLRPILAPILDVVLDPLQPTRHLTQLSGQFLILEGADDSLIPAAARLRLREAVPEPKTIITFDGDHMGVGADKPALLRDIIAKSRAWLVDKGAIDPF